MGRVLILLFIFLIPFIGQTQIQLANTYLEAREVAKNLYIPWDLDMDSDGNLWFSQRNGYIIKLNPEEDNPTLDTIYKVPEVFQSADNTGLQGLALHPKFPLIPYIFVHYSTELYNARLTRLTYSINSNSIIDTSHLLYRIPGNDSHIGSRIVFEDDETIFLTTGDGYDGGLPQDKNSLAGKVLRLSVDGKKIEENPFGSYAYSIGHRNPQGLVKVGDRLFSTEHGTSTDDELNEIVKGENYGWPLMEGFCDLPSEQIICDTLNVHEPILVWTPTDAPCGMAYFNHESIPEWQNSLIISFLKAKRISVVKGFEGGSSSATEEEYLELAYGRIRDVFVSPNGKIYLATSNQEANGALVVKPDDDKIIELYNPQYTYVENKKSLEVEVNLFPNPADKQFYIIFEKEFEWVDFEIFNQFGRLIETFRVSPQQNQSSLFLIERSALRDGVYFVNFKTSEGTSKTEKVVFINQ